jgi:hypothetical protein
MLLVGVGIHVDTAILPKAYFNHLARIAVWGTKTPLYLVGTDRMKVASARNRITEKAIKRGCSHLLFIDSDHILPEDMLDKLLESKDKAMISGYICKRNFPYNPVVFRKDIKGDLQEGFIKFNTGIKKADAVAMGCTMLNLDIIQRLTKPYWKDEHFRSDINMCLRLKDELGEDSYVDTRIDVRHLGDNLEVGQNNADELRLQYLKEKKNVTSNSD